MFRIKLTIVCWLLYWRGLYCKHVLRRLFPAHYKALNRELMTYAAQRGKLQLWKRWRMGAIHWELGTSWVPSSRWNVKSAREYRARLKWEKQITNEIIDEILAEEAAEKSK